MIYNKVTTNEGISYITNIVEQKNDIFHVIHQEHDVGIDAIIEFVENYHVTGKCIAIQIKSGNSYYDEDKNECRIPIGDHLDYWMGHTLPVIGIVYVPSLKKAYWIDIKKYVNRINKEKKTISSTICFSITEYNVFDYDTYNKYFKSKMYNICRPLDEVLSKIDFYSEIRKKTEDYIGREWLEHELFDTIRNSESQVFLITGDPGSGKSAFLAHITDFYRMVIAHHFCMSDSPNSIDPNMFVDSIANQLSNDLTEYWTHISDMTLDDYREDAGTRFRWLIVNPLLKINDPGRLCVIVIDSLDESRYYGINNIADILSNVLSSDARSLPKWLKIVISSRKELDILNMFKNYLEIKIDSQKNEEDIFNYVEKKFNNKEIIKKLKDNGTNVNVIIQELIENSKGNFLIAKLMSNQILDKDINQINFKEYPNGLNDFYERSFQREFIGEDYEHYRILLSVLLAAKEPISENLLSKFLNNYKKNEFYRYDVDDASKDMKRVVSYFPKLNGVYRPFHKSIVDWLEGANINDGVDNKFQVNIALGHNIISQFLLDLFRNGNINDKYLLKYLPTHLFEVGKLNELNTISTDTRFIEEKINASDELKTILTDTRFIEEKINAGMVNSLHEDYTRIGLGNSSKPIILTARYHNGVYGMLCPSCKSWKHIEKNEIGQNIKCPTCKLEIKLNSFSVNMSWQIN